MSQIAFIAALCLGIGHASAAEVAERDLSKYRIQAVEIPMSAEIKELYGFMHEFHLFQNVLRFQWAESDIDIARSASMRPLVDMGLEQAGFDPESLRGFRRLLYGG